MEKRLRKMILKRMTSQRPTDHLKFAKTCMNLVKAMMKFFQPTHLSCVKLEPNVFEVRHFSNSTMTYQKLKGSRIYKNDSRMHSVDKKLISNVVLSKKEIEEYTLSRMIPINLCYSAQDLQSRLYSRCVRVYSCNFHNIDRSQKQGV